MASTTILDSGLPGNSHSGAKSNRRRDVPAYLEQVVYAVTADSDSPGAYRYDPAQHDPSIPDSDPRSPRYEPPHLRHQPGDTWIIERNRPHDPLDPGPYGSPGWYQDNRTGRHRRGELPDPAQADDDSTRELAKPVSGPTPEGTEERRPSPGPSREGVRVDGWQPPSNRTPRRATGGGSQEPPSRPRSRFWDDADDNRRYNFGKLREDAWGRFLVESEELHHAHFLRQPALRERLARRFAGMWAALLRIIGVAAKVPRPTGPVAATPERCGGRARVESPMAGTPGQGPHRTNPVATYMSQWERHFDAHQAFREAVVL